MLGANFRLFGSDWRHKVSIRAGALKKRVAGEKVVKIHSVDVKCRRLQWLADSSAYPEPSAFGNVWKQSNLKKPLRDKELTDSIEVIS